jgi:DNA topoisomerase I
MMMELTQTAPVPEEKQALLQEVDLHYVTGNEPGYTRRRRGRGFTYLDSERRVVRDPEVRARLEALVIPPAWQEVWICADPNGHLQATGRDEAGRKQYIYHPEWTRVAAQSKFERLLAFGEALPQLRAQVDADLRGRKLTREKVIALVVRLLELTLIRVGNPEYERQNSTYGLTTLLDDHVEVEGREVVFEFRGKSGKEHEIVLEDRQLARLVKACQELPGQRLFQYIDDEGQVRAVDSGAVNEYLRTVTGSAFTAKEFRTWGGTVAALRCLRTLEPGTSQRECERQVTAAVKEVAAILGNTPTVSRQHYIHPVVIEAYLAQTLEESCAQATHNPQSPHELDEVECALLALLKHYAQTPRSSS